MTAERYLNHPTFGMLYLVSPSTDDGKDLYSTLYAQKMFFEVSTRSREILFEVIPYLSARNIAESHLSKCKRLGDSEIQKWENLFKQTFI